MHSRVSGMPRGTPNSCSFDGRFLVPRRDILVGCLLDRVRGEPAPVTLQHSPMSCFNVVCKNHWTRPRHGRCGIYCVAFYPCYMTVNLTGFWARQHKRNRLQLSGRRLQGVRLCFCKLTSWSAITTIYPRLDLPKAFGCQPALSNTHFP